ncbi:MAG: YraN family protein [Geminicoccaceae bacterium]|nr:YraN family protein [Geminicoccaceae bacterium]MCS7269154.1 YraN family protein [Geminicoccaceae bacterium]MCX7631268.1 YraN family protein [Geminicoccaceae bacterium]MDW8125300.1 YraN family protein [Geminicoccaceae bacterium]MDW8342457.1 YraN family protein [Geminicoccaceae bacterium]
MSAGRGLREASFRRRAERRGRLAESLAAWLLRLKGFAILARRWSSPVGEIDIVARRGDLLVFVEVKRRSELASALEALRAPQGRRIAAAAAVFLAARPDLARLACRFDVVAVGGPWPVHLPDAWRP